MRSVLKKYSILYLENKLTQVSLVTYSVLSVTGWSNKYRLLSGYKLLALVFPGTWVLLGVKAVKTVQAIKAGALEGIDFLPLSAVAVFTAPTTTRAGVA